jgi:hypothetical protein
MSSNYTPGATVSGQELGYAENASGVVQVMTGGFVDVPGCSIVVPPTLRGVYLEAFGNFSIPTIPAAATTVVAQMGILDELGNFMGFGNMSIYPGGDNTGFDFIHAKGRAPASTIPKTYRIQVKQAGGVAVTQLLNGNIASAFKTWISVVSA